MSDTVKREQTVLEEISEKLIPDPKKAVLVTEEQIKRGKKRIAENLRKEAEEVDPRLMFLKLKKAFVEQYGRISAACTQSNDAMFLTKQVKESLDSLKSELYEACNKLNHFDRQLNTYIQKQINIDINSKIKPIIDDVNKKLDFQQQIFKKAVELMNKKSTPWYIKIWNKIKCKMSK